MAGIIDLFPGRFCVRPCQFDLEVFANVNGADALISHVRQGALHRFALRINDRFFGRDDDFGFQRLILAGTTE